MSDHQYNFKDLFVHDQVADRWVCQVKKINEKGESVICGRTLAKLGNTTGRHSHLNSFHPHVKLVGQINSPSKPETRSILEEFKRVVADPYPEDSLQNKKINKAMIEFIIACNLPISIVDHIKFKEFVGVLDPRFVPK
mgnify:CR=1 FL=1